MISIMERAQFSKAMLARFCSEIKQIIINFYPFSIVDTSPKISKLIEDYLQKRSRFDQLAFTWVQRSFSKKITSILLFIGGAGTVGLIVWSSPFFVALFGAVIALLTHNLLIEHEKKRQENAIHFVTKVTHLNEHVQKIENQRQQESIEFNRQIEILQRQNKIRNEHVQIVEETIKKLKNENTLLSEQVVKLKKESESLHTQEELLHVENSRLTEKLTVCSQAVNSTTQTVTDFNTTAKQFFDCVSAISETKNTFSTTVEKFGLFVQQQAVTTDTIIDTAPDKLDEFITQHRKYNEASKKLMVTIQAEEQTTKPNMLVNTDSEDLDAFIEEQQKLNQKYRDMISEILYHHNHQILI